MFIGAYLALQRLLNCDDIHFIICQRELMHYYSREKDARTNPLNFGQDYLELVVLDK
jgi:hypothetical protein